MAKKAVATKPEEITVEGIFGPGGLLEKQPSRIRIPALAAGDGAGSSNEAFQKHQHAVIEAGTGTGKTLAYLIPAIRSGRRVVVSTATKSLQEQLFQKDVPFLQKTFCAEPEGRADEGPRKFPLPSKSSSDGGPAGPEGDR